MNDRSDQFDEFGPSVNSITFSQLPLDHSNHPWGFGAESRSQPFQLLFNNDLSNNLSARAADEFLSFSRNNLPQIISLQTATTTHNQLTENTHSSKPVTPPTDVSARPKPRSPGASLPTQSAANSQQQLQFFPRVAESLLSQPEARLVNHKQWFRMMKRRIKKEVGRLRTNPALLSVQGSLMAACADRQHKTYKYESRHAHAQVRPRGKDGRFLATRPEQERFREKKKRGRKPKIVPQIATEV